MNGWTHWLQTQPVETLPDDVAFTDIVVPSTDTIRTQWLVLNFVLHGLHALVAGPTGTGKTIYIKRTLARGGGLDPTWCSILLTFSAQTSANQTQALLDSKLDKRRKGIYGPPMLKVRVLWTVRSLSG